MNNDTSWMILEGSIHPNAVFRGNMVQHGATISLLDWIFGQNMRDLRLPSRYGLVLIALQAIFRFKMLLTHLADPNRLASVIAVLQNFNSQGWALTGGQW